VHLSSTGGGEPAEVRRPAIRTHRARMENGLTAPVAFLVSELSFFASAPVRRGVESSKRRGQSLSSSPLLPAIPATWTSESFRCLLAANHSKNEFLEEP